MRRVKIMREMKKREIHIKGIKIKVKDDDFISLTDIAKHRDAENPSFIVRNWLKNQSTLLFLETWESVHNPKFSTNESIAFRLDSANGGFSPIAQKYIERTEAISLR